MRQKSTKILLVGTMLVVLMGFSDGGFAQVNVNVGIGVPLPSVVIPSLPPVVLIAATYVYLVPDISADILFYHGLLVSPPSRASLPSYELQWAMGFYRFQFSTRGGVTCSIGSLPGPAWTPTYPVWRAQEGLGNLGKREISGQASPRAAGECCEHRRQR
jgi:hypothetical protein